MPQGKTSWSRVIIFAATLAFVALGTIVMIRYAKGYRPTITGSIKGTGLLSANSFPTAAQVYIAGELTSATDTTINLDPGSYNIEIKKDGYHTWSKTLRIEQELVTATNALLLPTSPSLEPLTFTNAINPVPSPDGTQILYSVASASAESKNGLYVQDLSTSPITLSRSSRQIARSSGTLDYSRADYTWAPGGGEVLVAFESGIHVLLEPTRLNDAALLRDVTSTLPQLLGEWEEELARLERARLLELPDFFVHVATASAINLYFSPDGEKLLYLATADFDIPEDLTPPLLASSTQKQARSVQKGSWYTYDLIEDRNFLVSEGQPNESEETFVPSKLMLLDSISSDQNATSSAFHKLQQGANSIESLALLNAQYSPIFVGGVQWFPDSSHLVVSSKNKIDMVEYDGTNRVTIYAGPFDHSFVYAAPDASRIVTLIQFSPDASPNLYAIKLK